MKEISKDETPCAVKIASTVWSGGKLGDYFKELPITIDVPPAQSVIASLRSIRARVVPN